MTKKPTQLGRYQIETHLGAGAHADVYRAVDSALKRTVALKVLKPALMAEEDAFARFTREAQVLAGLVHPRIAWVWDMGEAKGRYFIAVRYVEGRSLDKVIAERGPIPWKEALQIAEQVADGLQFAHEKGLVHRDVKPQNIIVSETEGAVLTDFGLVRAIASSGMTTTGAMLGTPHYMAPEVWEGDEVGPGADQYALACILTEMLTGKVLFDGKTPPVVMAKHFKPPELPASWAEGVPAGLDVILRKALAHNPAERYASLKDFTAALAKLQIIVAAPVAGTKVEAPKEQVEVQRADTTPTAETVQAIKESPRPVIQEKAQIPPRKKIPAWIWALGGLLALALAAVCLPLVVTMVEKGGIFGPVVTADPNGLDAAYTAVVETVSAQLTQAAPTAVFLPTVSPTKLPTETPAVLDELTDSKGVTMRLVPAGEFTMGSNNGDGDEKPVHQVVLDAFYMDKYEVTNAFYKACVTAGVCNPPKNTDRYNNSKYENHPVVYVDWNMAKTYCEWRGVRLPTEAEWEKAARGTDGRTYPWGEGISCNRANYYTCVGDTTVVGSYESGKSPYGLYDMAGNVWEWVSDWYDSTYYANSPASNPQGPTSGDGRALRGGSWDNNGYNVRTSNRYRDVPSSSDYCLGFRCSRSLP